MISEKIINGVKVHFNHDLYLELRKVHPLKNVIMIDKKWNHFYHEGNKIMVHPLMYKVLRKRDDGTLVIMTRVMRQFFAGWHTVGVYDTVSNSSGIVYIDNGSSIALPSETDFEARFEVTDITPQEFFGDTVNSFAGESEPAIEWFNRAKKLNYTLMSWFDC